MACWETIVICNCVTPVQNTVPENHRVTCLTMKITINRNVMKHTTIKKLKFLMKMHFTSLS